MRVLVAIAACCIALRAGGGTLRENLPAASDATQTYTLFLPSSYDDGRQHPLLLVFDPGGRGTLAANIFRAAAEELGWIVISSNDTRSGDDGTRNRRAVLALLDEVHRYRADRGRLYTAGFSGTAILADVVALRTNSFAGVIAVGGRVVSEAPPSQFRFAHLAFAGDFDFNNRQMRLLDAQLEAAGTPHRFQRFEGAHEWITSDLARTALAWMDVVAMKQHRRERDATLIDRAFARDIVSASALESGGRVLDALREYEAIARTYAGLHPLDEVQSAIRRLSGAPALERDLADEAKWDAFEERFESDVFERLATHLEIIRRDPSLAVRQLRVPELEQHARRRGYERLAGKRLLEGVYARAARELAPVFASRGEHSLAAALLVVAARIHPERTGVWYQLGGAYAQAGSRRRALKSLRRAIELGFKDASSLTNDPSYAPLRTDPEFEKLVASIRQ